MNHETLDRIGPLIVSVPLVGVLGASLLRLTPIVRHFLLLVLLAGAGMFFRFFACNETRR